MNSKSIKRILRYELITICVLCVGVVFALLEALSAGKGEHSYTKVDKVGGDTITDIDGNIYTTVKIGDQVWMVENLKITRYRDSSEIANIANDTVWSTQKTGAYCWYGNDSTNKEAYGALYNFYAVIDSCGLCPEGWHVPTESEWRALVEYLGGEDVAGGKLKEVDSSHWNRPNIGATDESGFRGLPGGGRGRISGCGEIGEYATWWSSTAYDSVYAWHWGLSRGKASVRFNPGHKASGFSVRCVKD